MPVSTKTKAIAGLAALDVARQVATAWSARERARREQLGFGAGLRRDLGQLAHDARDHMPDLSRWELERGWPPIHRRSRVSSFLHSWAAVVLVVFASVGGVIAAARYVARHEEELDEVDAIDETPVTGAIRSGSNAIDAGVQKIVDGGSNVAAGTASAVEAGSSAVRTATVSRARAELDERVVAPVKRKAVFYGSIGVAALTVYVIIVATVVALLVGALG